MPKTKQFKELIKNVKETYLGKPVKRQYQKQYGKIYDEDEIESIAFGIARSRGIKTDFKRR
jgi:hypothetical protein